MNKVSESIFSCKVGIEKVIIPMADVQHIEVEDWGHNIGCGKIRKSYTVKLKNSSVRLKHHMGEKFMKAWCYYRYELEGGDKRFKSPNE